jgi:hypothetical protein
MSKQKCVERLPNDTLSLLVGLAILKSFKILHCTWLRNHEFLVHHLVEVMLHPIQGVKGVSLLALYGRSFTVYTDHKALVYLHTQKELNPLLAGYLEVLLDYQFDIVHCPGIHNVLPDHLSQIFPASLWEGSVVSMDTKNTIMTATKYDFHKKKQIPRAPVVHIQEVELADEDNKIDLDSSVPLIPVAERPMRTITSIDEQKEIIRHWHQWGHYSAKGLAWLFRKRDTLGMGCIKCVRISASNALNVKRTMQVSQSIIQWCSLWLHCQGIMSQ